MRQLICQRTGVGMKTSRHAKYVSRGHTPSAPRFVISRPLLIQPCVAGSEGSAGSVGLDPCSLGLCREHTLICIETEGGWCVSCTCERDQVAARLASDLPGFALWPQHRFRQTIGSQQSREHSLFDLAIIKSNENCCQFFWSFIFFFCCFFLNTSASPSCVYSYIKQEMSLTALV